MKYMEYTEQGRYLNRAILVAPTHEECDKLTASVRGKLKEAEVLRGAGRETEVFRSWNKPKAWLKDASNFQPGMTITDEPGIYEEGLVGVRIENELLVVEHMETKYGKFYAFQPITYLPIDTTPVVLELMNEEEISWLNDYHQMVYDTLSPRMTERERIWLKEKTKPLEK